MFRNMIHCKGGNEEGRIFKYYEKKDYTVRRAGIKKIDMESRML